jgi:hypothetical protein
VGIELSVIEGIEEFPPELERSPFPDASHFGGLRQGNIPVELAWTEKKAQT